MKKTSTLVAQSVTNASVLVKTGNFAEAEKSLVLIADTEGDKALVRALNQVPPGDLGRILVATATLPSAIVGDLVTPKQFLSALLEVPKTWSIHINPEEVIRQLSELFLGVVMRPNIEQDRYGKHAPGFLKEIATDDRAVSLLAWWLGQHDYEEVIRPRDEEEGKYEHHEGDFDHLLSIILKQARDLFFRILHKLQDGLNLENLFPGVAQVSKAGVSSALGNQAKRWIVFGRSFIQDIEHISMFGMRDFTFPYHFSMQNSLQMQNNFSFFEIALSAGVKESKITREKVDEIMKDGSGGIIQIASVFENPYQRTGLEAARNRMVALISLYLEAESEGDVNRAIEIIRDQGLLDISKGGSEMIKKLGRICVDEEILEEDEIKSQYQFFQTPTPWSKGGNFLKYQKQLSERQKIIDRRAFGKELLNLTKIDGIVDSGVDIVEDIFLPVVTGKNLESEILQCMHDKTYSRKEWDMLLGSLELRFPFFCKEYSFEKCLYLHNDRYEQGERENKD